MTPRHEMIRASAGSGKTHTLVSRFVGLLLGGVTPRRVVALTFTRKAAAEFFVRIMKRLAETATVGAAEERDGALGAMRMVLSTPSALNLGTLDSFFGRMLQTFALELGLPGGFEVIDGPRLELARNRLLRLLVRERKFVAPLANVFEETAFGEARFDVQNTLATMIANGHELLLAAPNAAWGRMQDLWEGPSPWESAASSDWQGDVAAAIDALARFVPTDKRQKTFLEKFLGAAANWSPGSRLDAAFESLGGKLLPAIDRMLAGEPVKMKHYKECDILPELGTPLARLLARIANDAVRHKLALVEGMSVFLTAYESLVDRHLRRAGRLSFGDVAMLLRPERFELRGLLDYRLDTRLDHWMLDEFQDTSRGQWDVLANLLDEVIQSNDTGSRSFFAVGDVKQAIYGFRGGDSRLFGEILERYNQGAAEPRVHQASLDKTYRMAQQPVSFINRIFGVEGVGALTQLPLAARERWGADWHPHSTARQEQGCVQVKSVATGLEPEGELEEGECGGVWDLIINRLREISPTERHLTCAVLCRNNNEVLEGVAELRAAGLDCSAESVESVAANNALGQAVRSAFHLAAHPGDRFAERHIQMTPLAELVAEGGRTFASRTLEALAGSGFEVVLREWLAPLRNQIDAFHQMVASQLLDAAAQFDLLGDPSPEGFVDFLDAYRRPSSSAPFTVQLMTVHKSKGLEFDLVLLPLPAARARSAVKAGDLLPIHDENSRVAAVVALPQRWITSAHPRLVALAQAEAEEDAFSELCLAYVALTRARNEIFIAVTRSKSGPKEGEQAGLGYHGIIASLVPEDVVEGDPEWFAHQDKSLAAPEKILSVKHRDVQMPIVRPRRFLPSALSHSETLVEVDWSMDAATGTTLGTAVHEILAQIEWDWPQELVGAFPSEALELARSCFDSAEIRAAAFTRPAGLVRLLREERFEWLGPEGWMSGAVDRAVVYGHGSEREVLLFDYKTDQATPEETVERYRAQLLAYRGALAALAGVEVGAVRPCVIHCRSGRLLPVLPT